VGKFFINKKINKIKLAITTACNLRCPYCFVERKNEMMNFETAKKSVDILINSPGKDKLLAIYGGEPILNFNLIQKIYPYVYQRAKDKKKNLFISICSNFILFSSIHLKFIRDHSIKLIISLVGTKEDHDRMRNNSRRGTYNLIKEKIPLLFKIVPKDNIGVSFCIFPSTIENMINNFKHLINLGFNHFNFEIIRIYEKWTDRHINIFKNNLTKIRDILFKSVINNDFIFLNSINWEIKYGALSRKQCPFNYNLEVYPNGEMAFSPFLLNLLDKDKYIIGNVNNIQPFRRFIKCQFKSSNKNCKECETKYYKEYNVNDNGEEVWNLYSLFSRNLANYIKIQSRVYSEFNEYIKRAKNICF